MSKYHYFKSIIFQWNLHIYQVLEFTMNIVKSKAKENCHATQDTIDRFTLN